MDLTNGRLTLPSPLNNGKLILALRSTFLTILWRVSFRLGFLLFELSEALLEHSHAGGLGLGGGRLLFAV